MQTRHLTLICTLVLLLGILSSNVFSETSMQWKLEKQKNGVSVYSQEKKGSEFLQIKIEVNLPATVIEVTAQFGDGSECLRWQKRCLSSKVVKTVNGNEKLVYTTLDMPWPLTTRDFLFHTSQQIDPITNIYKLALRPTSLVEVESTFVRAVSNIFYKLEPIDTVSSKLTMLIHTDLGGDIPPSFVNARLIDELYEDIFMLMTLLNE